MRVSLSQIVERGEGPYLLFPRKSSPLSFSWLVGGRSPRTVVGTGFLVPVGDSIVRQQLAAVHVGCEGQHIGDEGADQLDAIFALAGVPFRVAREPFYLWPNYTENYVAVRFPNASEETPIPGSRYEHWAWAWGMWAFFIWWQCESPKEHTERQVREARETAVEAEQAETERQLLYVRHMLEMSPTVRLFEVMGELDVSQEQAEWLLKTAGAAIREHEKARKSEHGI